MGLWLRPEVVLTQRADADCIRFSHWEVVLPAGFVQAHEDLHQVLLGRASADSVAPQSESAAVVALLQAQGGFVGRGQPQPCTLAQLRTKFDPLRSHWYAQYYAHPLWQRLRSGQATRNELLAWVVHNYHISRVAGVVAARCASSAHTQAVRQRFLQDMFEEYWHVDAYYFVKHPKLQLSDEQVKRYVPLPASRAFELHTLQMAVRDPWAHLLIAYFQESTAFFYDDCANFYQDIERAYDLPGFFEPWLAHMRLDVAEDHAGGLAQLFVDEQVLTPQQQSAALRGAWLAYRYLYHALDQVQAQALPGGALDARAPEAVYALEPTACANPTPAADRLNCIQADLLQGALDGALACLGYTLEHDALIALGRLCRSLERALPQPWLAPMRSIWTQALAHLLQEHAHQSACLTALLHAVHQRCALHGVTLLGTPTLLCLQRLDAALHRNPQEPMAKPHGPALYDAQCFVDLAFASALIDEQAYQA